MFFVSYFFCSALFLWASTMLCHILIICSFYNFMVSVEWIGYNSFSLPFRDMWVASSLSAFMNKAALTILYMSFDRHILTFLLGIFLGMELLCH